MPSASVCIRRTCIGLITVDRPSLMFPPPRQSTETYTEVTTILECSVFTGSSQLQAQECTDAQSPISLRCLRQTAKPGRDEALST